MADDEEYEDEGEGSQEEGMNFSLLSDKSVTCRIHVAAWDRDKDLIALATSDHQIVVHRLNWQRLWAQSPEGNVTALCWRPDGKALAVGHDDGSIAIYDVEKGDVIRRTQAHDASVQCLTWAEQNVSLHGHEGDIFTYEDRTSRLFPPPPKASPMPGTAPRDVFDIKQVGSSDGDENGVGVGGAGQSAPSLFNVLCSGDCDGVLSLSVFGAFPIGKISLQDCIFPIGSDDDNDEVMTGAKGSSQRLLHASALEISLSPDMKTMTVLCRGRMGSGSDLPSQGAEGLYCICINTSIIGDRMGELRQMAFQATRVLELLDLINGSIAAAEKQWVDAMSAFGEKMKAFSELLAGNISTHQPRDEFLAMLSCGQASPSLHQFLAVTLREQGLKRLAKNIENAGLSVHSLMVDSTQPALELIMFRLGELLSLARWAKRTLVVGLNEDAVQAALEHAGMALVQGERMIRLTSDSCAQYRTFFLWMLRNLRQLNEDGRPANDMLPHVSTSAVTEFLQKRFASDDMGLQLAHPDKAVQVELSPEDKELVEDLALMGGFSDTGFLCRTLRQQLRLLGEHCTQAFSNPTNTISPTLHPFIALLLANTSPPAVPTPKGPLAENPLPPSPLASPITSSSPLSHDAACPPSITPTKSGLQHALPLSKGFYVLDARDCRGGEYAKWNEYVCFQGLVDQACGDEGSDFPIGIVRVTRVLSETHNKGTASGCWEGVAVRLDPEYRLVDLALYKEHQLALLVADSNPQSAHKRIAGGGGNVSWLMLLPIAELPFQPLDLSILTANIPGANILQKCLALGAVVNVGLADCKARALARGHTAAAPLAVSATRGLACVFTHQRRVLLYDLEEDEEPKDEDME